MHLPPQPRLEGALVRLEPLRPEHAADLFASASDPEVWRWKLVAMPQSEDELRILIQEVLIGPARWPFVVRRTEGTVIGSTTLANFDLKHGCVEMGFTWLTRSAWGQGFNEDAKRLLLRECFEALELHRVEWQCDAQNERSIAALRRLGFTYEGLHRSRHVRPDGTRRDSLCFSLLRDEWPACDARLAQMVEARRPTGCT
jgi:RimJ/RimL family protein N-acetyltransferase